MELTGKKSSICFFTVGWVEGEPNWTLILLIWPSSLLKSDRSCSSGVLESTTNQKPFLFLRYTMKIYHEKSKINVSSTLLYGYVDCTKFIWQTWKRHPRWQGHLAKLRVQDDFSPPVLLRSAINSSLSIWMGKIATSINALNSKWDPHYLLISKFAHYSMSDLTFQVESKKSHLEMR